MTCDLYKIETQYTFYNVIISELLKGHPGLNLKAEEKGKYNIKHSCYG